MLSGWNWTPWILYFLCITPMIILSLVVAVITRFFPSVFLSIIKLWYLVALNSFFIPLNIPLLLCLMVLNFPCIKYLALIIFDPNTCPMIWWPKHTPSIGIFFEKNLTIFKQLPDWFGLPGPGEITILSNFFFYLINSNFVISKNFNFAF